MGRFSIEREKVKLTLERYFGSKLERSFKTIGRD
jgi:hypothetical protein